jgi:hypothetical protein
MDRGYATASVICMRVAVGQLGCSFVLGVMNLAWIALLAASLRQRLDGLRFVAGEER